MPRPPKLLDEPKALALYIDDLIEENLFKDRGEVAKACGLSESALSNALNHPDRTLTLEPCLRLARRLRVPPQQILEMAGLDDMIDVVDGLFPKEKDPLARLPLAERELLKEWRKLKRIEQRHMRALISHFARMPAAGSNGRVKTVYTVSARQKLKGR